MDKIRYLGQIINKKGRRPYPARASAINDMPLPTNLVTRQSFLGLANYYNIYMPDMYELQAPLNNLLKKGIK